MIDNMQRNQCLSTKQVCADLFFDGRHLKVHNLQIGFALRFYHLFEKGSYTPNKEGTTRYLLIHDDPDDADKLIKKPKNDNKAHYEVVSYIQI